MSADTSSKPPGLRSVGDITLNSSLRSFKYRRLIKRESSQIS